MAIKLLKVGNSFNVPQKQYICDTEDERDALKAYFGDLALVIETGLTYILNSEGTWMDYPTGGGGGGIDTTMVAADFSEESPYDQNDLVINEGTLYRATTDVEAGPFDETKWAETNLAAEIEARGGAAAVHPDWNEGSSQSPNYIQNRTHYMNTVTDLVDPTWDGDPESENAPEITEITPLERYKVRWAGMYKLTDDPEADLDEDNIVLQWHAEADLGGGNVIEVDYRGIFTEVMYSFASEYYAMFGASSAQEAYQALMQMTQRSSQSSDRTWPFRTQEGHEIQDDSIVTSQLVCGESFANYILVQVNTAGTYQIYNEGTPQEVELETGWYAIAMKSGGDGTYFTSTPIVYSDVVQLDYKYMPDMLRNKIETLNTQVGALTPLDIELKINEIPEFTAKNYTEGDIITRNGSQYEAKQTGFLSEFNADDWIDLYEYYYDHEEPYKYYLLPHKIGVNTDLIYFEEIKAAVEAGRPIRMFLDGTTPAEFKSVLRYSSLTEIILTVEHEAGAVWQFVIKSVFNEDWGQSYNKSKLPYLLLDTYDISPYGINPLLYSKDKIASYIYDRRLMAIRDGQTRHPQSLILTTSNSDAASPWLIALEGTQFKKHTFSSEGATTETILDIANIPTGSGGGNASALEPEEMLELLMDPELNVGGPEDEPMANVYGVEENGEMVALGYTETVNGVSTEYILVF